MEYIITLAIMHLVLYFVLFKLIQSTIDITLGQLEYIANQLTPMECQKLNKYLHSPTYEVTTKKIDFIAYTERTCIELLIHWNSSPEEGFGTTHSVLAHRLNQIGRRDLGEWLSNSVFSQSGKRLNRSVLASPFKEFLPETSTVLESDMEEPGNNSDLSLYREEPDWETYDTIAVVVAIFLSIAMIFLLCELCGCFKYCQKMKKKVKSFRKNKYTLVPQEDSPLTNGEQNANMA